MITVEAAKKLSAVKSKWEKIFKRIDRNIRNAAEDGKTSVEIQSHVPDDVRHYLVNAGWLITQKADPEALGLTIGWGDKFESS